MSKNGSISFYAGCPEGAYRVLKRVDFFFFTRDALRGHTVSKNGSISFFFFFFFFFYAGCPEGAYRV